jgi:methanogenic corrinoid protein MtbC1
MDRLNPQATGREPWALADSCADLGRLLGDETCQPSQRERLARLAEAIERDILPRLAMAHRQDRPDPSADPEAARVVSACMDGASFAALLISEDDGPAAAVVDAWLAAGAGAGEICLRLLTPAARELGRLWDDDRCSFSDVTVGMGRLQRLMRRLAADADEHPHLPPDAHRVLLLPVPGEHHTFGLAVVAEFFRRAGWDVLCPAEGLAEPATLLRSEWFDLVGFSMATPARLDWLRRNAPLLRQASRNPDLALMVGGPLFLHDSHEPGDLGVDALARDAQQALRLAAGLLARRVDVAAAALA